MADTTAKKRKLLEKQLKEMQKNQAANLRQQALLEAKISKQEEKMAALQAKIDALGGDEPAPETPAP